MNLDKVKHISYNPNSGEVIYEEDSLVFNEGDKNVALVHLRGTIENFIRVDMKILKPGGEVVVLTSKVVTNLKNVCREFAVEVNSPGEYECQLILSYKDKINVSNKFTYKVLEGIKGEK